MQSRTVVNRKKNNGGWSNEGSVCWYLGNGAGRCVGFFYRWYEALGGTRAGHTVTAEAAGV